MHKFGAVNLKISISPRAEINAEFSGMPRLPNNNGEKITTCSQYWKCILAEPSVKQIFRYFSYLWTISSMQLMKNQHLWIRSVSMTRKMWGMKFFEKIIPILSGENFIEILRKFVLSGITIMFISGGVTGPQIITTQMSSVNSNMPTANRISIWLLSRQFNLQRRKGEY